MIIADSESWGKYYRSRQLAVSSVAFVIGIVMHGAEQNSSILRVAVRSLKTVAPHIARFAPMRGGR